MQAARTVRTELDSLLDVGGARWTGDDVGRPRQAVALGA